MVFFGKFQQPDDVILRIIARLYQPHHLSGNCTRGVLQGINEREGDLSFADIVTRWFAYISNIIIKNIIPYLEAHP